MGPQRTRVLVAVAAVLNWVGLVAIGSAWIVYVQVAGDLRCQHPLAGDSLYGELRWSKWPPGPTCTWTKEAVGFDDVRGPSPVMSIWLVAVAVLGLVAVLMVRRAWQGRNPGSGSGPGAAGVGEPAASRGSS
jgi:hypothetical protein